RHGRRTSAMGRIEEKACVVTGAASGIGRATAERFAEEGGRGLCVGVDGDGGAAGGSCAATGRGTAGARRLNRSERGAGRPRRRRPTWPIERRPRASSRA